MDNRLFPVTHSIVAPDALALYVIPNYDLGDDVVCQFLNMGLNDTYLVSTSTGRYILRIYRAEWRTLDEIKYEIEILRHLERRGVAVGAPIAARSGLFVDSILAPEGTRYVAMFTYAQGKPDNDEVAAARSVGAAAAAIHNASDTFECPYHRPSLDLEHLIDASLNSVFPFLTNRPVDQAYLRDASERLRAGVLALPAERLDTGFCHGDFHGGNAHINDDMTATFFDFDCCGLGWRAYDLAVYRWSAQLRNTVEKRWPAFLAGYTAHRSVSDLDMRATQLFVPIRHVWYLGLITTVSSAHGRGWMNDDFWDGTMTFLRACVDGL